MNSLDIFVWVRRQVERSTGKILPNEWWRENVPELGMTPRDALFRAPIELVQYVKKNY